MKRSRNLLKLRPLGRGNINDPVLMALALTFLH